MSEQGKTSVFDHYGKRREPKRWDGENRLSVEPVEEVPDAVQEAPDTENAGDPPGLEGDSRDDDDDVIQGGVYKAAFIYKSKGRQRLRLHYANGLRVKVLSYAYLIEMVATSHQWLTLVFSSTVVTLKGQHLDQLIEPLQDERVRALICFRPGIHPEPEGHAPCILEIEERSLHQFVSEMAA